MKIPVLSVENVSKVYLSGDHTLRVLNQISFLLEAGATCSIVGPSGSGKSKLLGICAGLDEPSEGTVTLAGQKLATVSQDDRARLRATRIGFVFQNFQLIPTLTAIENVMVPAELSQRTGVRNRAAELLKQVGLADRVTHYPVQLSGGEQQRVALARAFINEPQILFADEPTGNLDAETSALIVEALFRLNQDHGTALVLVTHDLQLAEKTHRTLQIRGGALVKDGPASAVSAVSMRS